MSDDGGESSRGGEGGRGLSRPEHMLPAVYEQLRALARGMMSGRAGSHTLQPTALVNEACAKLLGSDGVSVKDRAHFLAVAAMAMRQVLADHARAGRTEKRSAPGDRVTLSEVASERREVDMLALDDALEKLGALDARQARLVELRFFSGMTMEEASLVLGASVPTLEREWRAAKAFLRAELGGGASP